MGDMDQNNQFQPITLCCNSNVQWRSKLQIEQIVQNTTIFIP